VDGGRSKTTMGVVGKGGSNQKKKKFMVLRVWIFFGKNTSI